MIDPTHAHEMCTEQHPPDGREHDRWSQPHCVECGGPIPLRTYVAANDGQCVTCGASEANHDRRFDLYDDPLTCLV